jgi:hypothetical protein
VRHSFLRNRNSKTKPNISSFVGKLDHEALTAFAVINLFVEITTTVCTPTTVVITGRHMIAATLVVGLVVGTTS